MITQSTVGRTTVGGSWTVMNADDLYLIPVTVPADRLLANIAAHVRHQVANVPSIGAYVYTDSAGAPGDIIGATGHSDNAILGTPTGRWFHFPIDMWFPVSKDVWIGIAKFGGNPSFDLASDAAGGSGGIRATFSDTAAWTPGTNNWSIHGVLFG